MDALDVSELQAVGGLLTLVVLFVLREFASGALKKAGEEFWLWVRRGHAGGHAAGTTNDDTAAIDDHAEAGGGNGERVAQGLDDERSPCLLPLDRGEAQAAATRRPPMRGDVPFESRRKSA